MPADHDGAAPDRRPHANTNEPIVSPVPMSDEGLRQHLAVHLSQCPDCRLAIAVCQSCDESVVFKVGEMCEHVGELPNALPLTGEWSEVAGQ